MGFASSLNTGIGGQAMQAFGNTGMAFDPSDVDYLLPFACTARALTVQLTAAPGAGSTRTFQLVVNNTPQLPGCQIVDANTACVGIGTFTFPAFNPANPAANHVAILSGVGGAPAAPSAAYFSWECR
jgi:hypothetical protein